MLPGLVMVASGAACLGGAVAAKNRIGIAAATVMLLAMLDLVTLQLVPAPVWALLLVAAALALGARLRVGAPAVTSKARVSAGTGLRRAVMVASAVSYVAMAWLVMTHSHASSGTALISGEDHLAHPGHTGGVAEMPGVAAALVVGVLIAVHVALFVASLRSGRRLLALEAGAMAAMLLAMLVPGLFA